MTTTARDSKGASVANGMNESGPLLPWRRDWQTVMAKQAEVSSWKLNGT